MKNFDLIEPYLQAEIDPAYAYRARYILEDILTVRPSCILDVGCGRGFYLNLLDLCDFPETILGTDIVTQHLEAAKPLPQDTKSKIALQNASLYELPYKDSSIDTVVCSEVLEHLEFPEKGVAEITRVLKRGGRALITVPSKNFPFFWDPLNWILMRFFGTHVHKDIHWLAGIWADHEKLYDLESIRKLFTDNYEIEKERKIVSRCWPFSHFMLYGIGKNLVEKGFFSSCNRFSLKKPSLFVRMLARFMMLPSLLIRPTKNETATILFLSVKKK